MTNKTESDAGDVTEQQNFELTKGTFYLGEIDDKR